MGTQCWGWTNGKS